MPWRPMPSARAKLQAARTCSISDNDTTLPQMTGDAGSLTSTTTSDLETHAVT
jgi:hypothetical protein